MGFNGSGREGRHLGGAVLAALFAGGAGAGELRVGTEYVYPTSYEVVGGQLRTGQNGVGLVQETVVVPRDFAVREVGVVFSVEATVSGLNRGGVAVAALEQRNKNGNTELMLAATAGDTAQVRRLLARGALVNARNNHGSTALMGAAAGGFDAVVELLLARGALVNGKSSEGSTPLMFAARNGHTAVVRHLIGKGANVNDTNRDGFSPLLYAINGGHDEVVSLLLENGARTDTQDRHGTTPLALANAKQDPDVVVLLTRGPAAK